MPPPTRSKIARSAPATTTAKTRRGQSGAYRSADELDQLQGRVNRGLGVLLGAWVGFRVAMAVYDGPRISLALAIIAGSAAVTWLSFVFLPDPARGALAYLVALFLS